MGILYMNIEIIETLLNGKDPNVVIADIKVSTGDVYSINLTLVKKGPYKIESFDLSQGILVLSYTSPRSHKQTIFETQGIEYIQLLEGI